MTFIASVKARNGVAIIADSLVTTTTPVIELSEYKRKLQEKKGKKRVVFSNKELVDMFKHVPSHTQDFEDKLFRYDDHTAITTTGIAIIDDKRIYQVISEIKKKNCSSKDYSKKGIEDKIAMFRDGLNKYVKSHIDKHDTLSNLRFIITHYDPESQKTRIFRINVLPTDKMNYLKEESNIIVTETKIYEKVVMDGQNATPEGVLYGNIKSIGNAVITTIRKIKQDFNIEGITKDYIKKLLDSDEIFDEQYITMKMLHLKELSLQQAVDLANLLIHLEMDFQKYTKNIPTVGGVTKIAVIDENGFRFISGDKISIPNMV